MSLISIRLSRAKVQLTILLRIAARQHRSALSQQVRLLQRLQRRAHDQLEYFCTCQRAVTNIGGVIAVILMEKHFFIDEVLLQTLSKMVTPSRPYRHSIALLSSTISPIPTPVRYPTHVLRPACVLSLLSID